MPGPLGAAFAAVGMGVSLYGTIAGMQQEADAAQAQAQYLKGQALIEADNARKLREQGMRKAKSAISQQKAEAGASGYTMAGYEQFFQETEQRLIQDAMALELEHNMASQNMLREARGISAQRSGIMTGGYLTAAGQALSGIGSIASGLAKEK